MYCTIRVKWVRIAPELLNNFLFKQNTGPTMDTLKSQKKKKKAMDTLMNVVNVQ